MRSLLLLIALSAFATPAGAEPRQVLGYAGLLGEWELTASVTEKAASQPKEFSGPLTMTHVGLCTVDDPEEKKGVIRMRMSEADCERQYWSTVWNVAIAAGYRIPTPGR